MKICMITTSEIFHDTRILNEASSLAKFHEVVIVARKYPSQKQIRQKFSIILVDYMRLPFFQLSIVFSLFNLALAVFKQKTDVYHAHDLDGLLCAYPAAMIRRKKLIYDAHEYWSETYPFSNLRGIQWLFPILEKFLIKKVYKGITVNESLAKNYQLKYQRPFTPIYNAFSETLSESNSPIHLKKKFPRKKIVLHLGSADQGRGYEQMIAAAQYLPNNFILVFVGGGVLSEKIKNLVEKKRLGDKIHFIPPVKPAMIVGLAREADIGLALTQKISQSYYLSLPNKIFQYISSGVPVLGSNFPEFKKIIISNKIGEVVDPGKPKLIARKIIMMTLSSQRQKYQSNYKKLPKTKYNWKTEAVKLRSFYEKI